MLVSAAPPAAAPPVTRREDAASEAARSFDRLYESHVDRVFGLCLRMSRDRHEAESLTQDVFVRAWMRLPTFRGESAFGSWLFRLAVNVVLAARRSDGRRHARLKLEGDPAVLSRSTRPEPVEDRLDLERAIATLPPKARVILVLHDVEGYAQPEIAEMTGIAVGTVKSQLHRARRLLRERLER